MTSRTITYLSVSGGILLGIALLLGEWYVEKYVPDTKVLEWSEVSSQGRRIIEEIVPPQEGETYIYYYGDGFASFKEDGNLVTDKRVVSYFSDEDEMYVIASTYDQIRAIETEFGSTWIDTTVVTVNHQNPDDDFTMWFSAESRMDKKAVEYIQARVNSP